MKRTIPAALAVVVAGALVASGCGSSDDPSTTGTTRAAAGAPGVQYAPGGGDGPDLSQPPVNTDAAPPVVEETDAQLDDTMVKISTFPTVLDPRLWNGEAMKPDIRTNTIKNVNSLVKRLGVQDAKVDAVELFGSNASYEYDDKADDDEDEEEDEKKDDKADEDKDEKDHDHAHAWKH